MFMKDMEARKLFNPIGIPLINVLALNMDKTLGWKYPSSFT